MCGVSQSYNIYKKKFVFFLNALPASTPIQNDMSWQRQLGAMIEGDPDPRDIYCNTYGDDAASSIWSEDLVEEDEIDRWVQLWFDHIDEFVYHHEVNTYITKHNLWHLFKNIRSMNTHSGNYRNGRRFVVVYGIKPSAWARCMHRIDNPPTKTKNKLVAACTW